MFLNLGSWFVLQAFRKLKAWSLKTDVCFVEAGSLDLSTEDAGRSKQTCWHWKTHCASWSRRIHMWIHHQPYTKHVFGHVLWKLIVGRWCRSFWDSLFSPAMLVSQDAFCGQCLFRPKLTTFRHVCFREKRPRRVCCGFWRLGLLLTVPGIYPDDCWM